MQLRNGALSIMIVVLNGLYSRHHYTDVFVRRAFLYCSKWFPNQTTTKIIFLFLSLLIQITCNIRKNFGSLSLDLVVVCFIFPPLSFLVLFVPFVHSSIEIIIIIHRRKIMMNRITCENEWETKKTNDEDGRKEKKKKLEKKSIILWTFFF